MARPPDRADCAVVGGGPAGIVLGLILARAGVRVVVFEKHPDFFRDFRGDTVHPSTLTLLDELGLGERFAKIPHRKFDLLSFSLDDFSTPFADFGQLRGPNNHIAMVPQWDFLDLLSSDAADEPTFHLAMSTPVTELVTEDGRVTGVRYRTADGETGVVHAQLTVGCDGRNSLVRAETGVAVKEFPVPIDAWWFRLPRNADEDVAGGVGKFRAGHLFVLIDRGDYWQIAYLIKKGTDAERRARGIEAFRRVLEEQLPTMADRVDTIQSWDEVKFLDIRLNRMPRWYGDGVLCIGDAAHAMSSVGGVGINLAVQDAVAAATRLAKPLLRGKVTRRHLASVQSRRRLPTAIIQLLQRMLHHNVMAPILEAEGQIRRPRLAKLLIRHPRLRRWPARLIGIGPRPEHAPAFARRDSIDGAGG